MSSRDDKRQEHDYALGHSSRELERLNTQSRLIEPATREFFREAGIGKAMRVLDVGSGTGEVALLAAELVGATGEVVGTDRAAASIKVATERANARGVRNVSFKLGDPTEMNFERPFDAVVGRYVLLFQKDQARAVRKLARHARPGGVIVFHEPDWSLARSSPVAMAYDRCCRWIQDVFRQTAADTNMAVKLYRAFVDAGLVAPTMRMRTFIGGGPACFDFLQAVGDLVESMAPSIEQLTLATSAEIEATIGERLRGEVIGGGSLIIGRAEVGAWSKIP